MELWLRKRTHHYRRLRQSIAEARCGAYRCKFTERASTLCYMREADLPTAESGSLRLDRRVCFRPDQPRTARMILTKYDCGQDRGYATDVRKYCLSGSVQREGNLSSRGFYPREGVARSAGGVEQAVHRACARTRHKALFLCVRCFYTVRKC